jgi:hypothetical protein
MARSGPRRPAQGQQDKPEAPARQGEQPAAPGAAPPVPPSPPLHWGWHLALFLWATSFAFLLAYELLAAIIKALSRR